MGHLRSFFFWTSSASSRPLVRSSFSLPLALVLILAVGTYSYLSSSPFLDVILVGGAAGILGTVALDSVRIPAYLLGYMPMDLPVRFGTKALNLDSKFMLGMMPKVMGYVSDEMAKGVSPKVLMDSKAFPKLPVKVIRTLARPTLREVLQENKTPLGKVRLVGYTWHYLNGASFGVAHALLFGRGPWVFTVGFGLLLAVVFLTIIRFLVPPMKPGLKLPTVVLLAHVGVVLVLGLFTQTFMTDSADAQSLLHMLYSGMKF